MGSFERKSGLLISYWLLFGFFALGAVIGRGRSGPDDQRFNVGLIIGFAAILVMVGFRDRVGVDWETYVDMIELLRAP